MKEAIIRFFYPPNLYTFLCTPPLHLHLMGGNRRKPLQTTLFMQLAANE